MKLASFATAGAFLVALPVGHGALLRRGTTGRRDVQACPEIAGYTFYLNKDHWGSDMMHDAALQQNAVALTDKCSSNPSCVAVNTGE